MFVYCCLSAVVLAALFPNSIVPACSWHFLLTRIWHTYNCDDTMSMDLPHMKQCSFSNKIDDDKAALISSGHQTLPPELTTESSLKLSCLPTKGTVWLSISGGSQGLSRCDTFSSVVISYYKWPGQRALLFHWICTVLTQPHALTAFWQGRLQCFIWLKTAVTSSSIKISMMNVQANL